jgi:LDH2 family malate/lactate/ureidoglycolate dehydrogenase
VTRSTALPQVGSVDAGAAGRPRRSSGDSQIRKVMPPSVAAIGRPKNASTLQIIDPQAFAALDAFTQQMQGIADACRSNPPRSGGAAVRLPGDSAQRKRSEQLRSGIALQAEIMPALQPWMQLLGVEAPLPLTAG